MKHVTRGWGGILVAGALLAACGGSQRNVRDRGVEDGAGEMLAENVRAQRRGDEKVTEFDFNRDGQPDVWTYTVAAKDAEGRDIDRVVRKELDISGDGKVDITRYYGEDESIEREAMDLDFDGRVDQVNYFEKGAIVRKERDLDYDGRPDLWVHFERGRIARKERDTDGNGKVDYWEYWEADQVDRIGEDLDGDGTVDRWTKNPQTAAEE